MTLSVIEARLEHFEFIVDYFINADINFLKGMGAEKSKLPLRQEWIERLVGEFHKPLAQKSNFYLIWLIDNVAVGHSNINKISYGQRAHMHLHLWDLHQRRSGLGKNFIAKSIPIYFSKFKLKELFCEPYALNPAPHNSLKKVGFTFVKTYETTPGFICFKQKVHQYKMDREQFKKNPIFN